MYMYITTLRRNVPFLCSRIHYCFCCFHYNTLVHMHTHTHTQTLYVYTVQLAVYVMYKEVTFANDLMDFITGFDITVETIKTIFPSVSHRLDDFFYDAKSFAEAYLSKCTYSVVLNYMLYSRWCHVFVRKLVHYSHISSCTCTVQPQLYPCTCISGLNH